MARKPAPKPKRKPAAAAPAGRPSALLDTRIIYCGDCLDQLRKLPDACVDLIYIDPPFNSNRNKAAQSFAPVDTDPSTSRFASRAVLEDLCQL